MSEISTKPYLIRALFEWCNDSGYTPYVTVAMGEGVLVPAEHVKDGEIVLNVSPLATSRLAIGNDFLEFQARFGGVTRDVRVPVGQIRAIYARETGQGMAFETAVIDPGSAAAVAHPAPAAGAVVTPLHAHSVPDPDGPAPEPPPAPGPSGERPRLTRVK
jgi:stringent starvation protein B